MKKHRILLLTVLLLLWLVPAAYAAEAAAVPTAEELAEEYLLPVSRTEIGTAGSSLKQAITACRTAQFAADNRLWEIEKSLLQTELTQAWQSLDETQRFEFSEMMSISIAPLLQKAYDDYTSVAELFETAGVGDQMTALAKDEQAKEAWAVLAECTAAAEGGSEESEADTELPEAETVMTEAEAEAVPEPGLSLFERFLRLIGLKG